MNMKRTIFTGMILSTLALSGLGQTRGARDADEALRPDREPAQQFDCGFRPHDEILQELRDAIARGDVVDPRLTPLPTVAPRRPRDPRLRLPPVVTADDIMPFEDSTGLLLTGFSATDLLLLMGEATTTLLLEHGDNFDFTGFFLNFVPDHEIGSAFYMPLENDVTGIGNDLFEQRADFGIAGINIEGMVQMWKLQSWGADDTTMLAMGQEFEHRFAMFLNPLNDGRSMQGDNCGRASHWNWQIDGQGSGMEIREWIGSNPAVLGGDCAPGGFFFICRNSDIGGVWSYTDLYLMGYVSPAEMDAGNSELRFMEDSDCFSDFNGTISNFDSGDIIAANGTRIPDPAASQKNFRTGWIMIYQPGSPPTASQLQNAADILNMWTNEWSFGTLGRGTMDNTLGNAFSISFPNGTPDLVTPDTPTDIAVQVVNLQGQPDPASGLLHYSIDGGALQTTAIVHEGGDSFTATLPGVTCLSTIDFFVTIDALTGETLRAPVGNSAFSAFSVASVTPVFETDFEEDAGFTVSSTASDGQWDRGVPVNCTRGDPPSDFDGSGQAYLTDNAPIRTCNTDVDAGATTLTSPVIDLSAVDSGLLEYARWFTNDFRGGPGEDPWVVEITDDGVNWVELENTTDSSGWVVKRFVIEDFVGLTSTVQVRFTAADILMGSVVEAAVDAFKITALNCSAPCIGDLTGDGEIGLPDLAIILTNFGTPSGATPDQGDIDGDGDIDLADLGLLLSVFGTTCP